jgi:flagellar motor component MotA
MSKSEVEHKRMMISGLLALQAGDPPSVIQLKMLAYIPEKERHVLIKHWEKK